MVENSKLIIDYKSGFGICVKENQLGKCNYYNRRWLLKDFVSDILAIGAVMSKSRKLPYLLPTNRVKNKYKPYTSISNQLSKNSAEIIV